MNKKYFPLLLFLIMTTLLSACVLPATTAPSVQSTPKTVPTSAPPTLAIKTPIPTATKVASFQEILSGTQTALAIIRGGTPEDVASTPEVEVTETVVSGGTPQQTVNALGTKTTSTTNTLLTPQVSTTPTVTPPVIKVFEGIPGVPTFGILKVNRDTTVTIQTNEFPANTKYVVKMGPAYTYALGGTVIGTFDSGKGGTLNETYNIPAALKETDRIDIRVEFPDGRYSYNYFFNLTVN